MNLNVDWKTRRAISKNPRRLIKNKKERRDSGELTEGLIEITVEERREGINGCGGWPEAATRGP